MTPVTPEGGGPPSPCPTCVREGGPYRCCRHCPDDPGAHDDGQHDHHGLPCNLCVLDAHDTAALDRLLAGARREAGERIAAAIEEEDGSFGVGEGYGGEYDKGVHRGLRDAARLARAALTAATEADAPREDQS